MLRVLAKVTTGIFRYQGDLTFRLRQRVAEERTDFQKRRAHEDFRGQRTHIERGARGFIPLVSTCTEAIAPQSHLVMKRFIEKPEKQNLPASVVADCLRCRLSFALLRMTVLCIRTTRSKKLQVEIDIKLTVVAARMDL